MAEVKKYQRVILISDEKVAEMNRILAIKEGHAEEYDRDGTIETFSTVFETPYGEYGVDIKVCNADTPYVDPVLFAITIGEDGRKYWSEMFPLDVDDTLTGEYVFELTSDTNNTIMLTVYVVAESQATSEQIETAIAKLENEVKSIEENEQLDRHDLEKIEHLTEVINRYHRILEERE